MIVDSLEILNATGSTDYFVNVYLESVIKPFGLYDFYSTANSSINGKLTSLEIVNQLPKPLPQTSSTFIVTGYCDNRLDEIKTYEKNHQFKVGIKGVTNVDPGQVEYTIDDIKYITLFDKNNTTIFIYKTNFNPDDPNLYRLLFDEMNYGYAEKPIFHADIYIDRPAYTITDAHLRLANIKTLFDFETYGGNFYKIFQD